MSVVPEATASGTAPTAQPDTSLAAPLWWRRSPHLHEQAIARAARPDYPAWLAHVKPAAACTRPIRLAGTMTTVEAATGRLLAERHTADMPDGVIYKPCGNRRASVCPSCSKLYQNDAYQIVRTGLAGGKGVPEQVAEHPAVFPTFTAPSFGQVHTRVVKRHTCTRRIDCDCRPEPCHARRDLTVCDHGTRLVCFARHDKDAPLLGTPLCRDCYDYDAHAVWNLMSGELWRRTTIAVGRYLHRLARQRGIADVHVTSASTDGTTRTRRRPPVRVEFDKGSEMQRRAAVHFHAIFRLDGPDPDAITPPPSGFDAHDLKAAVDHAARTVTFTTDPHPAKPDGWRIGWGDQVLTKVITTDGRGSGEISMGQVAGYLAKYATKSTDVTGHVSSRLTLDTIDLYADAQGSHTERLVAACWRLGRARWTCPACHQRSTRQPCPTCAARGREALEQVPEASPYRRLQRWAHMLGFGGHFLTKSRRYSITFAVLRSGRVEFRRAQTAGPEQTEAGEQPTTLVVNFLQFVGAGWHTTADALLANTSAQMAREHAETARQYLTTLAA
ncbi:replication initiator [Paractinoplanes rishiriensis]|uniref:replication initiator n=1 Tax=Paractinoplanes rishiriensis TaxID=1050105 RepID=UPI001943AB97|nr:replication initiator [Actinoplanes rishiriensis]